MNGGKPTIFQRIVIVGCVLAVLANDPGCVRANNFSNNSFESPTVAVSPGYLQLFGSSTAIPGWTVLGDNIILVQTTYSEDGPPFFTGMVQFNAQDGFNSLDLTGGGGTNSLLNGIEQAIATTSGLLYELRFYVGRAQSNNGDSRYQLPVTVDLSINGSPRVGFTNSDIVPPGFVNWKQFTSTFVATGPSTTITFLNGTPFGTNFLGLDNLTLGIAGDFDFDGDIDGRDFLIWQRAGSPDPLSAGDLAAWRANYGVGPLATSVSVPEPGGGILLLAGCLAIIGQRVRCKASCRNASLRS